LVLAQCWPEQRIVLLDAMHRRVSSSSAPSDTLGLATRVTVVEGRRSSSRAKRNTAKAYGLVVARAFGSPAVTRSAQWASFDPTGASW